MSHSILQLPSRLLRSLAARGAQATWSRFHTLTLAARQGTLTGEAWTNPVQRDFLIRTTWPVGAPRADTTYVFVFLGEFGYELFNWQGVVRKFASQLPTSSRIAIAGRRGLQPFYETAQEYVEISDFAPFRESVAAAYWAIPPDATSRDRSPKQLAFAENLRAELRDHLTPKLRGTHRAEFIFSTDLTAFPGCIFGADRRYYGRPEHPGKIYGAPGLAENNRYAKIEPDRSVRAEIERTLGFDLDRPYALVQTRRRAIGPQHGMIVEEEPVVRALAQHLPVIVLSFDTGRALDSASALGTETGAMIFPGRSFREQSCLIDHAARCVFITNGDLGSHTYLPPFLGRDVDIIASREIFQLPSAPIDFWNRNVFRFGGQMRAAPAEALFATDTSLSDGIAAMLGHNFHQPSHATTQS
ncbi:MAG: hypothetical protein K8R23_13595 [Chthoniobacter sp.]|nr:hypothetical protein [Chthoniobacter sp.]